MNNKKPIIMCVDDENTIIDSLKIELKDSFGKEFNISASNSPQEAIEAFLEYLEDGYEVPVVISDYLMPVINGDMFLTEINKLSPDTVKIMLTGHAVMEGVTNAINNAGLFRFIHKPWDRTDLIMTINEAINKYNMSKTIIEQNIQLREANEKLENINKNLESIITERTRELNIARERLLEVNWMLNKEKEQLRILSITDSLTQLYNRGYILNRLSEEIRSFNRYKKQFCVALIDIDHFKKINDDFGHSKGDDVLKFISETMKKSLRDTDLIGRYGGEEFLLLLINSSLKEGYDVVERIRSIFDSNTNQSLTFGVTISGGIIEYKEGEAQHILQCVDELMYMAKKMGRNKICSINDVDVK